jgi:outer membrane receptor protein involved in Fe transport
MRKTTFLLPLFLFLFVSGITRAQVRNTPGKAADDRRTSSDTVPSRFNNNLDSVFVTTALGIKRSRNSLPYATQQVTAAELNRTPNTNFINNLSGKVAGLQITASNALGGSSNVILRGFKSLTQSNRALFVVDGVPYDNSTQNLGRLRPGQPGLRYQPGRY